MSIYRKNKKSMKQADKELIFQIEEEKDNETLFQTGKIWCDGCYAWIEQVELNDTKNYLFCSACGNGVVMLV